MKRNVAWSLTALTGAVVVYAGTLFATPANPPLFSSPQMLKTTLDEIDLNTDDHSNGLWRARLKTKGLTDLYVVTNVWKPGGTTGWHTHPVAASSWSPPDSSLPTTVMTRPARRTFSRWARACSTRAKGTPTSFATRAPSTRAPQQSKFVPTQAARRITRRSLCNARACLDSRQTGIFSTVSSIRRRTLSTPCGRSDRSRRAFKASPTRGLTTFAKATVVRRSSAEAEDPALHTGGLPEQGDQRLA